MQGAFMAADVVESSLRDPASTERSRRRFEKSVHYGLNQFSWFVYRMTRPAIRSLFMAPRNNLRMLEAVLSLMAGDLFRGTPIQRSLVAFKAVYYIASLLTLRRSIAAWLKSRRTLRAEIRKA
jgi:hypothetical protein